MEIVNLSLLKHPLNWFIVLFMLVLFGVLADVVLGHYSELQDALNPNPVAKN